MSKTFTTSGQRVFFVNRKFKSVPADEKQHRRPKWLGLVTLVFTFVLCKAVADAQPAKVWKVGVLVSTTQVLDAVRADALRHGLRDHGYEEGKNLTLEYRYADGKLERLPQLARELVEMKVDVIVVGGTSVAVAAKNATSTIPIVVAGAGDLVEAGLIRSYMNPGGNVTGVGRLSADFSATG